MDSFEKAFYHDGYQLGIKAVESTDEAAFTTALQDMYDSIDTLIASLFDYASQKGQTITCAKGCAWCCHQPVFALDYELDFLNKYINTNFSLEKQNRVRARAKVKAEKLVSLQGDDLLNAKLPCPLLENSACLAYSSRPMACRIYLSTNLNSCIKFYQEPEDQNSYPALLDFPMRAGRMMNEGFKAALKSSGIVAKEFRIEEKLV